MSPIILFWRWDVSTINPTGGVWILRERSLNDSHITNLKLQGHRLTWKGIPIPIGVLKNIIRLVRLYSGIYNPQFYRDYFFKPLSLDHHHFLQPGFNGTRRWQLKCFFVFIPTWPGDPIWRPYFSLMGCFFHGGWFRILLPSMGLVYLPTFGWCLW